VAPAHSIVSGHIIPPTCTLCESLSLLGGEHEPEIWQRQMDLTLAHASDHRKRVFGLQGVLPISVSRCVHSDSGNARGSMRRNGIVGDFDGGPLIFRPTLLGSSCSLVTWLLYAGTLTRRGTGFNGVRLTTVFYLNSAVLHCRARLQNLSGKSPPPAQ